MSECPICKGEDPYYVCPVCDTDEQSHEISGGDPVMEIMYEPRQIDEACRYIEQNNPNGFSYEDVWNRIWEMIYNYAPKRGISFAGTMGFSVRFSEEEQGVVDIEVYVNPSIGSGHNCVKEKLNE